MSNVNHANDRKAALIGQLMTLLIIFCSSKVFSKAFFSQLSPSGTRVSLISVASYWAGLLKNRSKIAKRNQLVCISKYLNKLSKITPHMLVYPPPTFGNYPNYHFTMCKNLQKLSHFNFKASSRCLKIAQKVAFNILTSSSTQKILEKS